jgi:hypothetical protein
MLEALGAQLVWSAIALAVVMAPAMGATFLLMRGKRLDREARRSPLTAELMRVPGETLRERLDELRDDQYGDLVALMLLPALVMAMLYVMTRAVGQLVPSWLLTLGVVVQLAYSARVLRRAWQRGKELDQVRLGLDAERAAGQALTRLLRQGAEVFHDLPGEKFNVDHVVVAPQGVFAVETKGYRKPNRGEGKADATVVCDGQSLRFPDWSGAGPLRQAERQARWLADWLGSATGEATHVVPVLVLPGWFVQLDGTGPVMVLNDKQIEPHLLKARAARPIAPEQMRRIVHQLEQRCRDVKPLYRPETEA